jgi:Family of unknown function (DUF6502)
MNSTLQIRLLQAIARCLRPLARVMLRSGINYRQFDDLARFAFVQEALGDKDGRGRGKNLSRVAIRTGLSRKEVSRIKARIDEMSREEKSTAMPSFEGGHAARVLQLWYSDARFLDEHGVPRALPFGAQEASFNSIVRVAGGDIPPGAVRAELLDAGAMVETENGLLRPIKRYFVPANVGEDLLVGFTHILLPVLEGLSNNTDTLRERPFVQRLAYSDRLLTAAVPLFREVAQSRAAGFLQSMDDWIVSNEIKDDSVASPNFRVGVGVFYYEGPPTGPANSGPSVDSD